MAATVRVALWSLVAALLVTSTGAAGKRRFLMPPTDDVQMLRASSQSDSGVESLSFALSSALLPGSPHHVFFFSHRSCSQNKQDECNGKFKSEIEGVKEEAADTGIYKKRVFPYFGLPDAIMQSEDWKQHVAPGLRGRGYWFWKPALADYLLDDPKSGIKEGDFVIYVDGDTPDAIPSYFSYIKEHYGDSEPFDMVVQRQPYCEFEWTKGDIFKRFGVDPNKDEHYAATQQYHANQFAFRVNAKTRKFMKLWEDAMKNYDLVSDNNSKEPNAKGFQENRHDQSMYSMLLKASVEHNGLCDGPRDMDESREDFIFPYEGAESTPWQVHETYGIKGLNVKQVF